MRKRTTSRARGLATAPAAGGAAACGGSPAVSGLRFQRLARRGARRLARMQAKTSPPEGLDRRWDAIIERAYQAVQQPWGGMTVHARTGRPVPEACGKYAVTVKDPGQQTVTVPATASRPLFAAAMTTARQQFAANLHRHGAHLGVFHDVQAGRIDIDPVAVVGSRGHARAIGAATRATGGAYHFRSGRGVFPPHAAHS